jgi:hypothetical protein
MQNLIVCSTYCKRPPLLYDLAIGHISKQMGILLRRHKAMKLRLKIIIPYNINPYPANMENMLSS